MNKVDVVECWIAERRQVQRCWKLITIERRAGGIAEGKRQNWPVALHCVGSGRPADWQLRPDRSYREHRLSGSRGSVILDINQEAGEPAEQRHVAAVVSECELVMVQPPQMENPGGQVANRNAIFDSGASSDIFSAV